MTVNFNNFFTINNYFNMPTQKATKLTKNYSFNPEFREDPKEKSFFKAKSQFFKEEKPKMITNLKPSKSNHDFQTKNQEVVQNKPANEVKSQDLVQINEERNSYNDSKAEILGYLLLVMIFVFFLWFGMCFLLRILDIKTNNLILDLAREDLYYCMLIPLIIPISAFAAYGNWVAMKFFRHS